MPGAVEQMVRRLIAARPPRAKSLVVTIFGDAVVPHGGFVWLGALIRWLAAFGIRDRAVRTAVYRLVTEGWFTTRSRGRRSDYGLTELGRHNFADAERRIYAAEPPRWTGEWCLVVLGAIDARLRDAARRTLRWHGFGEISPAVLVHPAADLRELRLALADLGLEREAIVLTARGDDERGAALRSLAHTAWDLRDLTADYDEYLRRFRPVADELSAGPLPAPEVCFQIRVLAIHEYRRILLRDPELPAALLPDDWVGAAARRLCRDVYRRVRSRATEHVRSTGETSEGRLPRASSLLSRRFAAER